MTNEVGERFTPLHPFIYGLPTAHYDYATNSTKHLMHLVGQNTGNLAFHYAIHRIFKRRLNSVRWSTAHADLPKSGHIGIMPCANQINPKLNMSNEADIISKAEFNIIALGLGAQASFDHDVHIDIPDGTKKWLRAIIDRAPSDFPNIGVRGKFTSSVIYAMGVPEDHIEILGCPSIFINPDRNLGQSIEARSKRAFSHIAVAGGTSHDIHLVETDRALVDLVRSSYGSYIVQSPYEFVDFSRGPFTENASEVSERFRRYLAPYMSPNDFLLWARNHLCSFFDISAWMEHLRRFDFVVGPRIHGVILALQAGVPALCIAHDSRTRELCETLEVPFILASQLPTRIDKNLINDLFRFDGKRFDDNRAVLEQKYISFFRGNKITDFKILNSIR